VAGVFLMSGCRRSLLVLVIAVLLLQGFRSGTSSETHAGRGLKGFSGPALSLPGVLAKGVLFALHPQSSRCTCLRGCAPFAFRPPGVQVVLELGRDS